LVANPEGSNSFFFLMWSISGLAEKQQPTFDAIFDSVEFSAPTTPQEPPPAADLVTYRRDEWGMSFDYPAAWDIMEESEESVILYHWAELTMFLVQVEEEEVEFSPEVFQALLEAFAGSEGDIEIGEPTSVTIGGYDAAATRVTAGVEGIEMTGPVAWVASPETGTSFLYVVLTVGALAEERQPTFDAIFDSVEFYAPTAPAPPPAVEGELQIINVSQYVDSGGTLHFVGEVQNNVGVTVEDVSVDVRLFDDEGEMLTDEEWSIPMNLIPDGDKSPFEVLFLEPPDEWATFEIEPSGEVADFMLKYTYSDLEIVEHASDIPDFGDYQITGQVRNTGDKDAQFVQVTITLYGADGSVVSVDYTFLEGDVLESGDTAPFEILIFGTAGPADSYRLQVQGTEAD
jgi:hypothetical protein